MKQHQALRAEFEKSQKDLNELGVYLGQKNDTDFKYMMHLLQFARSVEKVVVAVKKAEIEEMRNRRKEEAKKRKKEQKKLKEERRKEGKEKGSKKKVSRNKKLEALARDATEPISAADSLNNKLDALFGGLGSIEDVDDKKTKKSKKVKRNKKSKNEIVQQKMDIKISSQGANFSEDMLALLSIDNIQQRRRSRYNFNEADVEKKDGRKKKKEREKNKGFGLIDINELNQEPVYHRQSTALKITSKRKVKSRDKKKKEKK